MDHDDEKQSTEESPFAEPEHTDGAYGGNAYGSNAYGGSPQGGAATRHLDSDETFDDEDAYEEEEKDEPLEEQKNPRGLRTAAMDSEYEGEQESAASFRQDYQSYKKHATTPNAWFSDVKTNYLRPEEQAKAAVTVENGKLMRGGAALDTSDASGIGTVNNGAAGKHIFAMTPDEKMRSIDPWAAHTETPAKDGAGYDLGMVNHSSLGAVPSKKGKMVSGEVAAAGEIAAENGKLTQVSDTSGHYKPDNKMTRQGLEHFLNQGVDMHDVALKLTGKEKGVNSLHASAREFLEEKDHDNAEANMRERRDVMRADIKGARKAFKARQAQGQMNFAGQQVAATPARLDPRTRAPRMKKSQDLIGLFEGMY
jgi:hypothetical protein